MKVNNPRFPHSCKIYHISGESPFEGDPEENILYEGECSKYGNTSIRTFYKNNVVKGEYAVDVPGLVRGVLPGHLVDVTDYGGTCMVTECHASEMGTTVYFNLAKN